MLHLFTALADWLTYQVFALTPSTKLADAFHFFIEDTTKILFLLAVMVFIMSFFRSWLSPEKVRAWVLGKPRYLAYVLAVLLGAVTPFCSCSSIPLFIGFLSAGVPLGVTMAFLITSPMVNEVAVVLFGEALGWNFSLAYVAVGMGVGLLGGALIDALKLERWVEPFVWDIKAPKVATMATVTESLNIRIRQAWAEVVEIIIKVWPYLLVGVGAGAFLHGYVPREWVIAHADADNPWAVPVAALMGVPLYSNVTGIVPIAEVFLQKGVPVGTTLAFIMSTVAISLPELVILRKVLKPQMLVFFAAYLFIAFVLVGYLFNLLF